MPYYVREEGSMANYSSQLIQHSGIVAGVCKEIGLAEKINALIPGPRRTVSIGQTVVAMILNALGLSGRAVYLTKRYYVNRPVESLIGEGIKAEMLNDASLGTALDSLYEYGITELFFHVSTQILKEAGIEIKFAHGDSTTFSFFGKYNSEEESEDLEENVVHISKGYSKDHAPELNQVVAQLISANKSSIPIWIEVLSGNTSDRKSFPKTVKEFQKQFNKEEMPYIVMDSAFYSKENINECRGSSWVTRVPETIKEVKDLYQRLGRDQFTQSTNREGYACCAVSSEYGGVPQRWIVVFSPKAYEREIATFEKNLTKYQEKNKVLLKHFRNQAFACREDAEKELARFQKKLKYQKLQAEIFEKEHFEKKGRPGKNARSTHSDWYINGELADDLEAIEKAKANKGMFVLATNELSEERLSNDQLLEVYKDQGVSVERGFRFLKDPMFYAESLYLKKPQRIMALIMVMTLSLLVYSLAERKIRARLKEKQIHIWDQKNKATSNPTIRWIFMIFEDVLLLYDQDRQIKTPANIREEHIRVLQALGKLYEKMYFL